VRANGLANRKSPPGDSTGNVPPRLLFSFENTFHRISSAVTCLAIAYFSSFPTFVSSSDLLTCDHLRL
jgi:hypothetical protein